MVTWPFIPVSRPAACLASQAAGETAHLLLRRFSSRVDTPMIIVQATLNSSTGLVSYFNFTNLHLQKGSCKVTVTVICRGNPHELGCCPSSCPVNHFVHTPLSLHFGPWAREQRPTCRPNCVLCPSDCQWLQLLQCSTINFSIQTPSRQSALLGHAGRLCLRCSWGVCDGWVVLGLSFRFCLASPRWSSDHFGGTLRFTVQLCFWNVFISPKASQSVQEASSCPAIWIYPPHRHSYPLRFICWTSLENSRVGPLHLSCGSSRGATSSGTKPHLSTWRWLGSECKENSAGSPITNWTNSDGGASPDALAAGASHVEFTWYFLYTFCLGTRQGNCSAAGATSLWLGKSKAGLEQHPVEVLINHWRLFTLSNRKMLSVQS